MTLNLSLQGGIWTHDRQAEDVLRPYLWSNKALIGLLN